MGNSCGTGRSRKTSNSVDLTGIVNTDGSYSLPPDSRSLQQSSPQRAHGRKTAPTNNTFVADGGSAASAILQGVARVNSFDKNEQQIRSSNEPSPRQLSFTKDSPVSNSNDSFDFNLTERQTRLQQISQCENECSEILDYLYIGGAIVAGSWGTIKANNITRIVNCAKSAVANCFEDKKNIEYLTLDMLDGRMEDVTWHIFKVIHFIIEARKKKEKVLVHCEKGVSRSCSLVIAYYMWVAGKGWKDAFDFVKGKRSVCNPNTAFTCNLVEFGELINSDCKTSNILFRLASHLEHDKDTAVLKICRNPSTRKLCVPTVDFLDSRGVFVLVPPLRSSSGAVNTYVWKGKNVPEAAAHVAVEEAKFLHGVVSRVDEIVILREEGGGGEEGGSLLSDSYKVFSALLAEAEGADEIAMKYDDFYLLPTTIPPEAVTVASSGSKSGGDVRPISPASSSFTAPKALQLSLNKSPSTPSVPTINISAPSTAPSRNDDLEPPPLRRGADSAPISPSGVTTSSFKPQLYQLSSGYEEGTHSWEHLGVYDFEDLIETEVLLLFCFDRGHFLWLGNENNFYSCSDGSIDTVTAEIENRLTKSVALGDVSKHVESDDDAGRHVYTGLTIERSGRESSEFMDEFQRGQ